MMLLPALGRAKRPLLLLSCSSGLQVDQSFLHLTPSIPLTLGPRGCTVRRRARRNGDARGGGRVLCTTTTRASATSSILQFNSTVARAIILSLGFISPQNPNLADEISISFVSDRTYNASKHEEVQSIRRTGGRRRLQQRRRRLSFHP